VNEAVDGYLDLGARVLCAAAREFADELGLPLLEHLGRSVENLSAQICSGFRPSRLRLACGDDCIPEVLA
jgi:hypothetical protein